METIKHYLSVFGFSFRMALKAEMEYVSYTFCWLLMIPISCFSGFYVLKVIMEKSGDLNGWTFGQVAVLYGLSMFSHAFQDMFFIQTRGIENKILEGEFDRLLLHPMGVFFQFCTGMANICGIYDLLPGLIIFLYGCHLVEFQWTLLNIVRILIITAGGTLISAAVFTATGAVAFWTKKSGALLDFNLHMIGKTTSYPLNIYPGWFMRFFTFVIPLGFISFYPVCGLLGIESGMEFPLPLELPSVSLLVGIVSFIIGKKIFERGLKSRYESSGS